MYNRVLTHIVTLLFTVAFVVPRIASLHVLNHVSDDDSSFSCELCDILADSNRLDLINGNNQYIENQQNSAVSSFITYTTYNSPQEKIVSPTSVCNKPPPLI